MDGYHLKRAFNAAAAGWICDGYAVKVSYIGREVHLTSTEARYDLWSATVVASGDPPREGIDFEIQIDDLIIGHTEYGFPSRFELEEFLEDAAIGGLTIRDRRYSLTKNPHFSGISSGDKCFEILSERDTWFSPLNFRVRATFRLPFPISNVYAFDTALRRADPPFDGLADVVQSLGLLNITEAQVEPTILISVSPPADLVMDSCKLSDNKLTIVIHAFQSLDISSINISVRAVPGKNMLQRRQVSENFTWTDANGGKQGVATIDLEDANSALVMLTIGEHTVRRHWFVDPARAPNRRLIALSTFDKELTRLKSYLFENEKDSRNFEKAVASLLFMLGFIPVRPCDTEAPDLIVMTPQGQLVLVECTFRIDDIESKIGKLVNRREILKKATNSSSHITDPIAVLICRALKDQIANAESAKKHDVLLLTGESIERGIQMTYTQHDPDRLLEEALATLRKQAETVIDSNPP